MQNPTSDWLLTFCCAFRTGNYFIIPRFQRPFSWEKDQVEEFWQDVIAENESDYFIGSMVVYEENKNKKRFGIVDGQQRLTTITLTLCALRDAFDREEFNDLAEGVHSLIERRNIDNVKEYVLQPETSYPYFQEYIQKWGKPETQGNASDEEKLLESAYEIITSNIDSTIKSIRADKTIKEDIVREKIREKLKQMRSRILGLNVIYITLDNEDDAYVIFETMNTRGKDLNIADLLKSYLLKNIRTKNANVDVYKDKWSKLVRIIESAKGAKDIKFDEFLYHHWLSRYERYVPAKKLYKSIKREIRADKAKDYFDELLGDAKVYIEVISPENRKWNKNEISIRDSLKALNLFRVKQPLPMILAVMREYRDGTLKPKQTQKILEAIENFHFIFSAVTSQRSSGGISAMYSTHAIQLVKTGSQEKQLEVLKSLTAEMARRLPTIEEFQTEFSQIYCTEDYDKQKKLVQYILAKIDSHHDTGVPIDYEKMTIEHVYSQNSRNKDETIDTETIGKVGNLLLVTNGLNRKLANKSFAKKKEILKASRVHIDKYILERDKWDDEEIVERTKQLSELGYKSVWKLQ